MFLLHDVIPEHQYSMFCKTCIANHIFFSIHANKKTTISVAWNGTYCKTNNDKKWNQCKDKQVT